MPTRPTQLIATATTAGLLAVLAPGAASAARPKPKPRPKPCDVRSSRTIIFGRYARVYGKDGTAYVCVRSSGRKTKLEGAAPRSDIFRLAYQYVAWTSNTDDPNDPPHSRVNELFIPDRSVPQDRPYGTGGTVENLVLLESGAVVWAATPADPDAVSYVQGFDRENHSPDTLSSDQKDVRGSSLRKLSGKTIGWSYTDGLSDSVELY